MSHQAIATLDELLQQAPPLDAARRHVRSLRGESYLRKSDAFGTQLNRAIDVEGEACKLANELAMVLDDVFEGCDTIATATQTVAAMDRLTDARHAAESWAAAQSISSQEAPSLLQTANVYVTFFTLQQERLIQAALHQEWHATWQHALHMHNQHQANAIALALGTSCPVQAVPSAEERVRLLRGFLDETAASMALRLTLIAAFPYAREPSLALLRGLDTLAGILEPLFRLTADSHLDLSERSNAGIYLAACMSGISLAEARRRIEGGALPWDVVQQQLREVCQQLRDEAPGRIERALAPYHRPPAGGRLERLAALLMEFNRILTLSAQKAAT